MQRLADFRVLRSKWCLCATRLRKPCGQEGGKIVTARRSGRHLPGCSRTDAPGNSQQLWQGAQDPSKLRPDRTPAREREGGHEVPTLAKQLLLFNCCGERKGQFSLRAWHLVDLVKPHSQEQLANTVGLNGEGEAWSLRKWGRVLEAFGEGNEYD